MKKTWNEKGSESNQIYAWVPYAIYLKERERERENIITKEYKEKKKRVCMHEICMNK